VAVLYRGVDVPEAAARLRAAGAAAVVVTCGAKGAVLAAGDEIVAVPAPAVDAVDATGAGDSVMAALIFRLLTAGWPDGLARWWDDVRFALAVAGMVCERPGGAVAMPTAEEITLRWGPLGR